MVEEEAEAAEAEGGGEKTLTVVCSSLPTGRACFVGISTLTICNHDDQPTPPIALCIAS